MKNVYAIAFTVETKGDKTECTAHVPSLPAGLHAQMIDAYIIAVTSLLEEAAANGNDVSQLLPNMRKLSALSCEVVSREYVIGNKQRSAVRWDEH